MSVEGTAVSPDLVQVFEPERVSSAELADSQWKLVDALEREYLGKRVHNTLSRYEDDNWFDLSGAQGSRTGIHWPAWSDTQALKVLVKSMMWDYIFDRSVELSTAKLRYYILERTFLGLIMSRRLLTGKPGEVLLGLCHVSDDDLLMMLDAEMLRARNENGFAQTCNELGRFVVYARHYGERVPIYDMQAQLPWQKSGEQVNSWVKRRASDLNFFFPRTVGHEPLSGETAEPLVAASLTLIDDHFDHFSKIGPILAEYTALQNRAGDYVRALEPKYVFGLLEEYVPVLGHIVPAPDLSGRGAFVNKGRAVFLWLRALVKLCRAACLNIILLTSGLRNIDVRNLKVGSCKPSGRVDILFYIRSDIQKTGNVVVLPVPPQTDKAIRLLVNLKDTTSNYLIDWGGETKKDSRSEESLEINDDTNLKSGGQFNDLLKGFSKHFNIPFIDSKGNAYTAHNYRTTVAGWLGSASNLSLLLVRRLFGHGNNIMPTVYLNNNPAFVAEREAQKAQANAETARQLALAASQGQVAGVKGEQLERGYRLHKALKEADIRKSHSLMDAEIMLSFAAILEQRMNAGSMCGFLTPFGVICGRNPTDSSQPPCAKRAHRDKTKDIPFEILKHISDVNPQQCIGTSCTEALLGPWSTAILDTLIWYRSLLNHQHGGAFSEQHFIESAKQFIRQYEAPIKKIFGLEVLEGSRSQFGVRNG